MKKQFHGKHNNGYQLRQRIKQEDEIYINQCTARQMMMDAVFIAAHDIFGMGAGRAKRFHDAINANLHEIAKLTDNDVDGLWETKAKVDRKLKEIVGEDNFTPWEERYRF